MSRTIAMLIAMGAIVMATMVAAEPIDVRFPTITTQNLNGTSAKFPDQFPGERTVVLIAFKREQQKDLDVWIDNLGLKESNAPAWLEMPVISNYGSIWRAFVDNGMRSGIVTTEARSKVFTVYASPEKFRSKLNLPTGDQVYALVVSRDGAVLGRADGRYSEAKAGPIRKALTQ